MHLTVHSDYSLFLAAKAGDAATIPEIAEAYGISRGHLMKVVNGTLEDLVKGRAAPLVRRLKIA